MSQTKNRYGKLVGLLLAAVMLLVTTAPIETTGIQAPKSPIGDDYILNAGVTIKTQAAADRLFEQGGIRGIDVSKYQGTINWAKVANSDVAFAFIRSSYGMTDDPNFVSNAKGAYENGINVGAYHFATFKNSQQVHDEAAYFINRLKQVEITYPVVLDLEGVSHKRIKRSTLTQLAVEFMDLVKAEGYTVMLYSYNNFIRDHLDTSALGNYDLWIANYMERPTAFNHKVWQYTSYGTVSGVTGRVDINVAYEDLSEHKKIRVDKKVSTSIKSTLNYSYGAGLPLDGLNMDSMNKAISQALQTEINSQWGVDLPVDGQMSRDAVNYLAEVQFTSKTGGNITYLLQSKLFYKGHYTGELSSRFDENTVEAVRSFQKTAGLPSDGQLDAPTLHALLL